MNKLLTFLTLCALCCTSCTDIFDDGPYRYDGSWRLSSAYTEYQKMVEYDNADEIIDVIYASVDKSLAINFPAVYAVDSVNIGDVWTFNHEQEWLIADKGADSDTVMYELLKHPATIIKINYPVYQEDSGFVQLNYWSVRPLEMIYLDSDSMVLRTSGAYHMDGDLRSESQLVFRR